MKLKALITTLVLGSSAVASVAMAHPTTPSHAPAPAPAPIVRDHRAPLWDPGHQQPVYRPGYRPIRQPAPVYRAPYRPSWVTLGAVHHIADGEMTFRVSRFARDFSTLKLQSSSGKSLIYRVLIQFENGRTQTVELNQYLNASNPSITIDLRGHTRSIEKVTVIGRNARESAFRVMAI